MNTKYTQSKLNRQISFSQSFQYQNNYDKNNFLSPSIAIEQRIHSVNKNKDLHRNQSPLRNLHYKYLPTSRKIAELESQSLRQMQMLKKREESSQKVQNFCEINNRIKKLLFEIKGQENRKSYFCQKFAIQIPQNNQFQNSYHDQIKNARNNVPQDCEKYQSFYNNRNDYFSREYLKQKQNQFCTPTKVHQRNNFKNVGNFEIDNSPLNEIRLNRNDSSSNRYEQMSRMNSNMLKNSVYANLTEKRKKNNKQNLDLIIKGKNVEKQMQKLQSKIKQLQKMKKELKIQIPTQQTKSEKIIESKLTRNSMINSFQSQDSSIIENENYQSKDSYLLSFQSKLEEKDISEQKILCTESQRSNKLVNVVEQDVQLPKILRKMNEKKKKGKSQIIQSKVNQKVLYSQTTNCQDQEFNKQVQQIKIKATNQKNSLLAQLQLQIKLDENLRKVKKWFQKLKINNKWNILIHHLQKHQYFLTQDHIKNIFYLHPDQENPFYNPQEGDFMIDECVKAYLVADSHWKYEIVHNYSERSLTASNFNEQNIDISAKGHINIQDLTRYINCQLDSFYRNRDVYLIYQRLRTSQKLYYSDILNCLSNK